VPDRDQSTAPDDVAAQRGAPEDATGLHDISYFRQSALSRLMTAEAARRARKARREALLLLPVVAGLILMWIYREELFGTDVPIRIATALLLATVGWRFARDLGRAVGPRLMRRFDPGTASTVSFLVQLITLLVIVVFALRVVDLNPRAIALGGAVTAVVIGLAAQSTLGNVIAGIVLQASRPFRVGERIRLQGGPLGATVEGTVASQGLIYTTLARGNGAILVPNNAALGATIVPLRAPAGVDLLARVRAGVRPSDLERTLSREVRVPTRDEPDISLEEVYADGVVVRVRATPVNDLDGARLADEILAVLTNVAAGSPSGTAS
jgi:small-conductance mechanosensitive channel